MAQRSSINARAPLKFYFPGVPLAERKHQVPRGPGRTVRVDTPDRQQYKAYLRVSGAEQMEGPPLEGPLSVVMVFERPKPASYSKKRWAWTGRPDTTNLAKLVEDALTGIVWLDDAQIIMETIIKRFAPTPGITVVVETLEDLGADEQWCQWPSE